MIGVYVCVCVNHQSVSMRQRRYRKWKGTESSWEACFIIQNKRGGLWYWRYGMIEPCRLWVYSSLVGTMPFVGEGRRIIIIIIITTNGHIE